MAFCATNKIGIDLNAAVEIDPSLNSLYKWASAANSASEYIGTLALNSRLTTEAKALAM